MSQQAEDIAGGPKPSGQSVPGERSETICGQVFRILPLTPRPPSPTASAPPTTASVSQDTEMFQISEPNRFAEIDEQREESRAQRSAEDGTEGESTSDESSTDEETVSAASTLLNLRYSEALSPYTQLWHHPNPDPLAYGQLIGLYPSLVAGGRYLKFSINGQEYQVDQVRDYCTVRVLVSDDTIETRTWGPPADWTDKKAVRSKRTQISAWLCPRIGPVYPRAQYTEEEIEWLQAYVAARPTIRWIEVTRTHSEWRNLWAAHRARFPDVSRTEDGLHTKCRRLELLGAPRV